jgi:hypothetical protein
MNDGAIGKVVCDKEGKSDSRELTENYCNPFATAERKTREKRGSGTDLENSRRSRMIRQ